MAVYGSYLGVLTHLLKTRYIERVDWAFKRRHVFLAHVRRKTRNLSGNVFTHPVMTAETQGIGPGSETSDLPTPGHTQGINPAWSPLPHRARMRVWEQSKAATKDKKGAFLRAWAVESDSLVRRFLRDINIEVLGDGTGRLAYLPAADNETTVTVAGYQGPPGSHCVRDGMRVDVVDASDHSTLLLENAEVTARTATTVTVDSAPAGTAADDYFVRTGGNVSGTGYFLDGIQAIVNTADPTLANHGNIDRDTDDEWKGQQKDFGNSFSLDMLDALYDTVLDYTDYVPNFGITRRKIQRLIGRTLFEQTRFRQRDKVVAKPWKAVWYDDNTPIYSDIHCWVDSIFFLSLETFEFMQVDAPHWMDFDGAIPHRVTDKAAYEATYLWHPCFACHMPNANARGYDVKDPT